MRSSQVARPEADEPGSHPAQAGAVAASAVATGLICLVIAFVSLQAVYPSAREAARFIGYVLAFNVLPGLAVTQMKTVPAMARRSLRPTRHPAIASFRPRRR